MTWSANLRIEIVGLFADAQAPLLSTLARVLSTKREDQLEKSRDYYRFVRTAPAWRAKENGQIARKRRAARRARAEARPPCPICGAAVTRGADVPRGRKLPKYCSRKCMRAAVWRAYYERHREELRARKRKGSE